MLEAYKIADLQKFRVADLQNCRAILAFCLAAGITDAAEIDAAILQYISGYGAEARSAAKRRPDNITICAACGGMAVIVPLNDPQWPGTRIDGDYTHAIQCQNRPPADQPWRSGMCGHTEYIVRGDK